MPSVDWEDPCPQCQNPAFYEQNYIQEYFISCPYCGFHYRRIALMDRKVQPNEYKITKSNRLIYREYEWQGFGTMCFSRLDGIKEYHFLRKPITPQLVSMFNKLIATESVDPNKSYLSGWDTKTSSVISIVGKVPTPPSKMELWILMTILEVYFFISEIRWEWLKRYLMSIRLFDLYYDEDGRLKHRCIGPWLGLGSKIKEQDSRTGNG